jgi:predicted DNA-binding transcriptional regulator AlpA
MQSQYSQDKTPRNRTFDATTVGSSCDLAVLMRYLARSESTPEFHEQSSTSKNCSIDSIRSLIRAFDLPYLSTVPQSVGVEAKAAMKKPDRTAGSPFAVEAREAARICGISRTSWYGLRAGGAIPAPIRLGRRVLWRVDELRRWLDAGCPNQRKWQQIQTINK